MRIGKRVQLMTPHWYTAWFKDFAAEAWEPKVSAHSAEHA